jgi:maleylpyruvate isomerase
VLTAIDEITRSGDRLAASVSALTDADVRAPAALPGWTRGHVVAHVTCSVHAYLWMLALARTGTEPGPRATGAQLARDMQESAVLPAAALTEGLSTALAGLRRAAEAMPESAWDTEVTALAGWPHPARYVLNRAWREFETHHVDLDTGYRPADWPSAYVAWALDDTLAAWTEREVPVHRVHAVDLGRGWTVSALGPAVSGPGHALLGWLAGRTGPDALTHDGPLPVPPAWPLPLATPQGDPCRS